MLRIITDKSILEGFFTLIYYKYEVSDINCNK